MKKYVWMLLALSAAAAGCSGGDAREAAQSAASTPSPPTNAQPNAGEGSIDSAATPAVKRRPTIIFAGTSLTAGMGLDPDSAYPLHVQRMIDSVGLDYRVVNAGVSGETSSALLRRLDWLLREPFDVFVIETGANDGLRGIPVTTMRHNIAQIIDRARAERPDARILLVQMEAPPNMGAVYTREFRDAFTEVAREKDVPLLPFLLDGVAGNRELNQGDGIHPNYEGSRRVAQNVWKGLRPLLR